MRVSEIVQFNRLSLVSPHLHMLFGNFGFLTVYKSSSAKGGIDIPLQVKLKTLLS